MTHWDEAIAHQTFLFTERLERRGFCVDDRTLTGHVGEGENSVAIKILLPSGFPFFPPVITPPADFPRSWHREPSGAMCLYTADQRKDLPWLNVDEFITTVTRWINESRTGWVDDFPDLDLESYFGLTDEHLVVYGELDQLTGNYVQLRHCRHVTRVTGSGSIPRKKRLKKDRAFGYILNIGEPAEPPSDWDEIKALIPEAEAKTVEGAVSGDQISYLIVRYSRNEIDAAMVLRIWKNKSGGINLTSVRSASEAPTTLTLRAGASIDSFANARVAVVGVGAIGSYVCDLLARSGIGAITAYDPDIVRPGNLIRHLAGNDSVGVAKPVAVQRVITSRPFNSTTVLPVDTGPSPVRVSELFNEHDLVIDATASAAATALLAAAAGACGRHLVSACIQEEGMVVRIDVVPPLRGDPLPPTELSPVPTRDKLQFEAGCGDPVSQTPAFAVYEAAALAVRHAIGMLTSSPVSDAGTVRDYRV